MEPARVSSPQVDLTRYGLDNGGGGGESLIAGLQEEEEEEEREFNRKILRGKPTRCRVIPGRPALLGWRGRPRPSRTAPLGMTKTPTLRVSADMLVSQSRALSPGPPLWVTEREVPSRLRPALTLDKPRIGGGSGPNLSPVPKNRKHGCRPWWPFACPMGGAQAPSGGCERSDGRRAPPPRVPSWGFRKERWNRACALPSLWTSLGLGGGQDPTWRRGLPHGGTRAQALHSLCLP